MPGIVGLVTKMPRKRAELELLRMVETLRHESFYVTGTWVEESLGLYLGWTARILGFEAKTNARMWCSSFPGRSFPSPGPPTA